MAGGSLLLQDFPGETFYRLTSFEGGPRVDDDRVEFVVLDGQQRLTALYHAVYDTGPYVYAIRAAALRPGASIDLLEEAISSFTREEWDRSLRDHEWDGDYDWIPFYSLRSAADFFGWRDDLIARSPADAREALREKLSDAYRYGLEAFHTYQLPAVIVERELEAAAVARIFERVNRGGLTLSAFDLMVAKTFETGWNLRERWDNALEAYPVLAGFEDGMPVVRVIAMRASGSVREGDVLRLTGDTVRAHWDRAVGATAAALEFLRANCGVLRAEWVPYGGIVITLAGIAFDHDLDRHRDVLVSWFFSRAFALRYEGGANTVTVEQYRHLQRVIAGETKLEPDAMIDSVAREGTRKRRSAIWRAFMCVLAANGALDPITRQRATADSEPAHILPRSEHPPPDQESPHLLVLNLLLVDRGTAPRLNGSGTTGLDAVLKDLAGPARDQIVTTQLLPDPRTCRSDEEFLDSRLARLDWFLQSKVGYGFTRAEAVDVTEND